MSDHTLKEIAILLAITLVVIVGAIVIGQVVKQARQQCLGIWVQTPTGWVCAKREVPRP